MTRSRTKLLEQQVNSLLVEYDVYNCENPILPKSMHLCMIGFVDNTNASGGKHQDMEENNLEHDENKCKQDGGMRKHGENKSIHAEKNNTSLHKCLRVEREAREHEESGENNSPMRPIGES